jgi:hypothetical protein
MLRGGAGEDSAGKGAHEDDATQPASGKRGQTRSSAPLRVRGERLTCSYEGCAVRQTADDAQQRSKSKGGWLCPIHQKDLRLSVASLQTWNGDVLSGNMDDKGANA